MKLPPRPLPDSMACMVRYCRIDSGIESMSSPFSRCFFARSLILARLKKSRRQQLNFAIQWQFGSLRCLPILEPNLNRPLGHVNLIGYPIPHGGSGSRVLAELDLQRCQLILRGPLPLLVLLLLGEGAFPGRPLRLCGGRRGGRLARPGCRRGRGRSGGAIRGRRRRGSGNLMGRSSWGKGHRGFHLC